MTNFIDKSTKTENWIAEFDPRSDYATSYYSQVPLFDEDIKNAIKPMILKSLDTWKTETAKEIDELEERLCDIEMNEDDYDDDAAYDTRQDLYRLQGDLSNIKENVVDFNNMFIDFAVNVEY